MTILSQTWQSVKSSVIHDNREPWLRYYSAQNQCILALATVSLSFQQQLFQIQVYTTTDKAVLELTCIQSYEQYSLMEA